MSSAGHYDMPFEPETADFVPDFAFLRSIPDNEQPAVGLVRHQVREKAELHHRPLHRFQPAAQQHNEGKA